MLTNRKLTARLVQFIPRAILHVAISRELVRTVEDLLLMGLNLFHQCLHGPAIYTTVIMILLDLIDGGHVLHTVFKDLAKFWRDISDLK
jgi:hypothetical protein